MIINLSPGTWTYRWVNKETFEPLSDYLEKWFIHNYCEVYVPVPEEINNNPLAMIEIIGVR